GVRWSCRARASPSNADSVPSRAILGATFMKGLLAGAYYKGVDFVRVPAGPFGMGWADGHPCERPRHRVWVDEFSIARTPATNADFAAYPQATRAAPPPLWLDPGVAGPRQPPVGPPLARAGAA